VNKFNNFTSGKMKTTRRKFTAAFKAEVAIEAIKERYTLAELSKKYEVHPNMITKWKKEFLDRSAEIFQSRSPREDFESEKEVLYSKIGKLEIERDWLKKISRKAGL
jgi:transposase-like protein